ncbi:MAG: PAS domain-containing protein [Alphaproteobacteria bacterium]|nr:PAS domain-containing protein [Alphaproteobacteria bacterium]
MCRMEKADPAAGRPFDPAELKSERLVRAFGYWLSLRATRRVPDRADFDPIEIPDIMPHVIMWDVVAGGRYRCRLAGTKMVEIHGRELTGLDMAEFHGRDNATIQPEYDGVVRTGRPHHVERNLSWMHREYRRYSRILLPFSDGGADVRIVVNVAHFDIT